MNLTPTEVMVLQCVTWRVRLARKNGQATAVLTSTQASLWLQEKFHCSIPERSCQNALRRLGEIGAVTRRRCPVNGNRNTFAYGLPRTDEGTVVFLEQSSGDSTTTVKQPSSDSPTSPSDLTTVVKQPSANDPESPNDLTVVAEQPNNGCQTTDLYKRNKKDNHSYLDKEVATEPQSTFQGSPGSVDSGDGNRHPSQPFVPPAGSKQYRSTGINTTPTKIDGMASVRTLAGIEDICKRIGSGSLPVPGNNPDAYIEARKHHSESKDC